MYGQMFYEEVVQGDYRKAGSLRALNVPNAWCSVACMLAVVLLGAPATIYIRKAKTYLSAHC